MTRVLPVKEIKNPKRSSEERWVDCLHIERSTFHVEGAPIVIGVLWGEGVGPEVISAALEVLENVARCKSLKIELREGGRFEGRTKEPLTEEISDICEGTFERGGAVIQGPYSGRFVYDLRKQFDLFFKISPLNSTLSILDASRLKPQALAGLDILITRENSGGIYQGRWTEDSSSGRRRAHHYFDYEESQVRRFLRASAHLAKQRRRDMAVVWKESGLPSISALWRACAEEAAEEYNVRLQLVGADLMAYWLLQRAASFDVIATPNLFGDLLADLGAALIGSRGASFSGNFSNNGGAVYQTNHGAAFDLEGTDHANPAGQIFAVAMMLRESFGMRDAADAMEEAVRSVWQERWRTPDVAIPGSRLIGTREMGRRVASRAVEILESHTHEH